MQGKLVPVGLLIVLVCSGSANADATIDTLSLWDGENCVGALGEPHTAYFGQSFVALDSQLTSVSFLLDGLDDVENNQPDAADFHLLVTPLASTGDRPDLNTILFESVTYSTSLNSGFELFTIDIDIPVIPGQSYMWVLDAFVAFDGSPGTAAIATVYNSYDDGEFRSFAIPDPPNTGIRTDHDNYVWDIELPPSQGEIPTVDAAFSMTFVPEPTSFLLLNLASLAFCGRRR